MAKLYHILIFSFLFLNIGCGVYSFSGGSIPPEVKSISIDYFKNTASIVVPSLSQEFTDQLRNRFVSETNLVLVDGQGDWHFEGNITQYNISPVAPSGNETASLSRLTVKIKVVFTDNLDENNKWVSSFNSYENFDASLDLSSVEDDLLEVIIAELVDKIYNKSVVNW
ncbi:MAG: LptE family protein [Bacteroidetes bacterium]|nr:LptE family protein [Bacteroidota bacterium]